MAQQKDFVLPEETKTKSEQPIVKDLPVEGSITGKEALIGGGIVIVGALLFFFLSRWFSDYLVKKRRSPKTANRAGWSFFFFLTFTTALLVFGFLGGLWGNLVFIVPMGIFVIISLIVFIVSAVSGR